MNMQDGPIGTDGLPQYWNYARETMELGARERLILDRLKHQLRYVYETMPFYQRHYDRHGFRPESVQTLEDFTALVPPITKKDLVADQLEHPPFGSYLGNLAPSEMSRIHGSSGTSGKPTIYALSKADWERGGDLCAQAQWSAGLRPHDLMQVSYPFGMFLGSWALIQGAERLGITLFPIGVVDSMKQLEFIESLRPTVFAGTPSYCMHLASVAREAGIDLRASSVQKLVVGGEPGGSIRGTREALTEAWHARPIDIGTSSEMYPFQTNVACEHENGTHQIIDENLTEIVDRNEWNTAVPEGERGAVVYTHLWRRHQPMIRFVSGDESYMSYEPCPCGRTYPRLPEGILGRIDDMLIIRGANIFPSMVETALRQVPAFGPEFRIVVERVGALDEMRVEVEPATNEIFASADAEQATVRKAKEILKHIAGIRIDLSVVPYGSLPATTFKARRVEDLRPAL